MAYGTEVKATLGVDTTQVPQDMAKAREAFQNAGKEIENDAAKHGAGAGDKFTHALEHKLFGARHLSGALATALGLNIEKISEKIAGAIAGGAAEGWKEALAISEQNAKLIEAIIEARLSPKQLEEKHAKDLTRAIDESKSEADHGDASREAFSTVVGGGALGASTGISRFLAMLGWGRTQAEILKETEEKTQKVLEAQAKVEEEHRKTKTEVLQLEDQTISAAEKIGTLKDREKAVQEHLKKLQMDYVNGDYTEVELKKKNLEIVQKVADLDAIHREMKEKELAQEKRILDLEAKRTELAEQRLKLRKDEDKITDRSKLTVGELAKLGSNKRDAITEAAQESERNRNRAFSFGRDSDLTSEQVAARDKAEEIKDLEAKAERERLSGNQAGAAEALGRVGTLRDELVKSGFTKTTEGDPATALREQIAKDNADIKKTLGNIEVIEKGKYVNQ